MLVEQKRCPSHPGAVLRDLLPETGLTQSQLAVRLGIPPRALSELLRERRTVGTDMALRLARAFNTTPEVWLNLQRKLDLWQALRERKQEYERIKPLLAA